MNENKFVEIVFYKDFTTEDVEKIERIATALAKEINAEVHSRMSKTLSESLGIK